MARKPKITLTMMKARGTDEMGRAYYRIRAPSPVPGKRVTVEAGRWTEQEASDRLARVEARAMLGQPLEPGSSRRWTVSEVVVAYLEALAERHGPDTLHMVAETRRLAHCMVHMGEMLAERITSGRLEQYAGLRRHEPTQHGGPTAKSSIREECLALRRAIRLCHELGYLDHGPPPMPRLKGIPDDARPARRLTEDEVRRLIAGADVRDVPPRWEPREGTFSRELFDYVHAHPGRTAHQIAQAHPHLRSPGELLHPLARRGVLEREGHHRGTTWWPAKKPPEELRGGWALLLTVLAWTGRRPVAVFDARRRDCERLLDLGLPRRERLMFWRRDKGGVGRGWGPVAEPAYRALVERCRLVEDPDALLWARPDGEPWSAERFARPFHMAAAEAGVENAQLYDLRRFACTRLLRVAGGRLPVVRAYTGHKSDRSLLRYIYAEQGVAEDLAQHTGWSDDDGLRLVEGE